MLQQAMGKPVVGGAHQENEVLKLWTNSQQVKPRKAVVNYLTIWLDMSSNLYHRELYTCILTLIINPQNHVSIGDDTAMKYLYQCYSYL